MEKINKITVIAEVHGVKENIEIYKKVISEKIDDVGNFDITVGFEWNPESIYVHDGRFSIEHVEFLAWLRERGVTWFGFDGFEGDPKDLQYANKRDAKMAEEIIKKALDSEVVAIMGNVHALEHDIYIDSAKFYPTRTHLPTSTQVKTISYSSGSYYNFGIHEFDSKGDNPGEYVIDVATPVTPVMPLGG